MWKQKLCLGLGDTFGVSFDEQIPLIKAAGFDAVFIPWSEKNKTDYLVPLIRQAGLEIQSCHAPFNKTDDMWDSDENLAEIALNELINCVHFCRDNEIPIMVSHAFIGFDSDLKPNEVGLLRYKKVIDECKKCGIKIAFENTEGEEFLDAILSNYADGVTCGFCLDTGHEMCYNRSQNLLAKYGKYLFATHINDNLGVSDYNGKNFWTDDLHLLPFDGIKDWRLFAERLNETGYNDILTFELNKKSKPNRHENDIYEKMDINDYLAQAYIRACKVASLVWKY